MPRNKDAEFKNGGDRGPGWYDCWEMQQEMEKEHGYTILIVMEPARAAKGKTGYRIVARLNTASQPFGAGCYGSAFPGNGSKTMAAALYRALVQLDAAVASAWVERDKTQRQDDWLEQVT